MHFSLCFVWLCFAHIRQCPSSAHQGFCIPFRFVSHTAFPFMNRYTRKRMNEWISPVENISIYLSGPSLWSLPLPSQYFSCVSMITDVCRRVCPAVSPFAATQFCVSTSDTCINVSIWYSICLTFLFLLLCFAPLLLSSLPSFARFFLPSFLPQCQFSKRLNETRWLDPENSTDILELPFLLFFLFPILFFYICHGTGEKARHWPTKTTIK